MKKTITVLGWNRPEMLTKCLDALASCRGVLEYRVVVFIDGGGKEHDLSHGIIDESIVQNFQFGVDHHNAFAANWAFNSGSEFNVMVEDDAILTPDALEFANWYAKHPDRDEYAFMSIGDPQYKFQKFPNNDTYINVVSSTNDNLGCGFYTSAWCFSKQSWEKMSPFWNNPLKTQKGWDWSLSYTCFQEGWKTLRPEVGRATNIGARGVHSTPEWFAKHVAPAVASDGRQIREFWIFDDYEPLVPEWITKEVLAR